MALPKKTYVCIEKKQLSEDWEDELVSLFAGELAFRRTSVTLASPRGTRGTIHPGVGTSKGWKTQTWCWVSNLLVSLASESKGLVWLGPNLDGKDD